MSMQNQLEAAIDIEYAYRLAKQLESYRSNPVLGFKTAGSKAEFEAGEYIAKAMHELGLDEVTKDEITVDAWEFEKAQLSYQTPDKITHTFELGAYQTQFVTEGPQAFSLVYLSKGTAADYIHQEVKNKLVLIDINQRDEWWINFPVYQGYLKGAAALIVVQEEGYGEIDPRALNAQDIAGPCEAAAFSISQQDADFFKSILAHQPEVIVQLDAISRVIPNQKTYNIIGKLTGQHPETQMLLSAHYDSYFNGFQDDNIAIGMILAIAKSLKEIGYKPYHTILFCAMAAEEWGVINSKYDWSSGTYEELTQVHPEWCKKTLIDFNFELPAHAHAKKDRIRSIYEYTDFINEVLLNIKLPTQAYPEGVETTSPIETWSDDFSMAISGIPSVVNDFSSGHFMQTHYHSQFDNELFYQPEVLTFHYQLYLQLLLAFDQVAIAPLNFANLFEAFKKSLPDEKQKDLGALAEHLYDKSHVLYTLLCGLNQRYQEVLKKDPSSAYKLFENLSGIQKTLLELFHYSQNELVRLNWSDEVCFPHEVPLRNIAFLEKAITALEQHNLSEALTAIYEIDNNKYAFLFEKEVYEYFTKYVFCQTPDRLKWGTGRIVDHENLFDHVQTLKRYIQEGHLSCEEERAQLNHVKHNVEQVLNHVFEKETYFLKQFNQQLEKLVLQLATLS